ncbi:MAG: hypothetical protein M3346_03595 [Actinomycetota bacterium]|nr:hypothetical protein [Actinomycetota bacterium]
MAPAESADPAEDLDEELSLNLADRPASIEGTEDRELAGARGDEHERRRASTLTGAPHLTQPLIGGLHRMNRDLYAFMAPYGTDICRLGA